MAESQEEIDRRESELTEHTMEGGASEREELGSVSAAESSRTSRDAGSQREDAGQRRSSFTSMRLMSDEQSINLRIRKADERKQWSAIKCLVKKINSLSEAFGDAGWGPAYETPAKPTRKGPTMELYFGRAKRPDNCSLIMQTPDSMERYSFYGKLMQHTSCAPYAITTVTYGHVVGIGKCAMCGTQCGKVIVYRLDRFERVMALDTLHYYGRAENPQEELSDLDVDEETVRAPNEFEINSLKLVKTFEAYARMLIIGNQLGHLLVVELPSMRLLNVIYYPVGGESESASGGDSDLSEDEYDEPPPRRSVALPVPLGEPSAYISCLKVHPVINDVWVGYGDGAFAVFEIPSGRCKKHVPVDSLERQASCDFDIDARWQRVTSIHFSSMLEIALVVHGNIRVDVWDTRCYTLLKSLPASVITCDSSLISAMRVYEGYDKMCLLFVGSMEGALIIRRLERVSSTEISWTLLLNLLYDVQFNAGAGDKADDDRANITGLRPGPSATCLLLRGERRGAAEAEAHVAAGHEEGVFHVGEADDAAAVAVVLGVLGVAAGGGAGAAERGGPQAVDLLELVAGGAPAHALLGHHEVPAAAGVVEGQPGHDEERVVVGGRLEEEEEGHEGVLAAEGAEVERQLRVATRLGGVEAGPSFSLGGENLGGLGCVPRDLRGDAVLEALVLLLEEEAHGRRAPGGVGEGDGEAGVVELVGSDAGPGHRDCGVDGADAVNGGASDGDDGAVHQLQQRHEEPGEGPRGLGGLVLLVEADAVAAGGVDAHVREGDGVLGVAHLVEGVEHLAGGLHVRLEAGLVARVSGLGQEQRYAVVESAALDDEGARVAGFLGCGFQLELLAGLDVGHHAGLVVGGALQLRGVFEGGAGRFGTRLRSRFRTTWRVGGGRTGGWATCLRVHGVPHEGQVHGVPHEGQVHVVPHEGQVHGVPHEGQVHVVPHEGQVHGVPHEGQVHGVPHEGQVHGVPHEGQVHVVPHEGQVHGVPHEGQVHVVPHEGQVHGVPHEGQVHGVPHEGQVHGVPHEGQVHVVPHERQVHVVPHEGQVHVLFRCDCPHCVLPRRGRRWCSVEGCAWRWDAFPPAWRRRFRVPHGFAPVLPWTVLSRRCQVSSPMISPLLDQLWHLSRGGRRHRVRRRGRPRRGPPSPDTAAGSLSSVCSVVLLSLWVSFACVSLAWVSLVEASFELALSPCLSPCSCPPAVESLEDSVVVSVEESVVVSAFLGSADAVSLDGGDSLGQVHCLHKGAARVGRREAKSRSTKPGRTLPSQWQNGNDARRRRRTAQSIGRGTTASEFRRGADEGSRPVLRCNEVDELGKVERNAAPHDNLTRVAQNLVQLVSTPPANGLRNVEKLAADGEQLAQSAEPSHSDPVSTQIANLRRAKTRRPQYSPHQLACCGGCRPQQQQSAGGHQKQESDAGEEPEENTREPPRVEDAAQEFQVGQEKVVDRRRRRRTTLVRSSRSHQVVRVLVVGELVVRHEALAVARVGALEAVGNHHEKSRAGVLGRNAHKHAVSSGHAGEGGNGAQRNHLATRPLGNNVAQLEDEPSVAHVPLVLEPRLLNAGLGNLNRSQGLTAVPLAVVVAENAGQKQQSEDHRKDYAEEKQNHHGQGAVVHAVQVYHDLAVGHGGGVHGEHLAGVHGESNREQLLVAHERDAGENVEAGHETDEALGDEPPLLGVAAVGGVAHGVVAMQRVRRSNGELGRHDGVLDGVPRVENGLLALDGEVDHLRAHNGEQTVDDEK
ncbi:cuticle protein 38-like protein [Babesia caballi]|uniref:Cuticle protein 38-like protein n=1 Tax=Babesia caballi TaxID=5871 RepID=A0AAV4LS75_BABCB|nr:cuticle protein 38-like protein [Babesia caballi]